MNEEKNRGGRFFAIFTVLCLMFLSLVYGSAAMYFRFFPSGFLHQAFTSFDALASYYGRFDAGRIANDEELQRTNLWYRARTEKTGTTVHDAEQAFDGLTFYTSGDRHGAVLVDMEGNTVHEWNKTFAEVWPDPKHLGPFQNVDPKLIFWRRARPFPNGDVLVMFTAYGPTPWGLGLAKLDRDGEVLWRYEGYGHHDLDIGPDGTIYALTHDIRTKPLRTAEWFEPPYLEDFLVLLSPDGRELHRISLYDAADEDGQRVYTTRYDHSGEDGDLMHANTVRRIGAEFAAIHDWATEGDALILLRNMDTAIVVNPESGRIVWSFYLPVGEAHDIEAMPNGNMMLIDNLGHRGGGGRSRVYEFDPVTGRIAWMYHGTKDRVFDSHIRGAKQVLPNDNVLITESCGGRLLEVTRTGEIVWEFLNPARMKRKDGGESVAIFCGARRYAREDLPFLGETARSPAEP